MEYIIGGLWSGLELLASLFFSGAFLSRREKKWYQPLLFLSAWIFVCVYTNLELNRIIMQILSIMVYAALSCVVHDGKWYLHILLALISYLFLLITDALVVNGMCALLHLSYNQLMERMWLFITLTTIDKTIAVFWHGCWERSGIEEILAAVTASGSFCPSCFHWSARCSLQCFFALCLPMRMSRWSSLFSAVFC